MSYYILYVTETRYEAAQLAMGLNHALAAAVKVARPESGILKKPYRYLVVTTSATAAANRDLLRVVRAGVEPPRLPKLRLLKEWAFDVTIGAIEALTRLTCRARGIRT